MKSVRYSRYTGEDFGLSAEDLLRALSDFFLESGFNNPYTQFSEFNEHTLDEKRRSSAGISSIRSVPSRSNKASKA